MFWPAVKNPFHSLFDATVHIAGCFAAKVLNHPAVREALESIVASANQKSQQTNQITEHHYSESNTMFPTTGSNVNNNKNNNTNNNNNNNNNNNVLQDNNQKLSLDNENCANTVHAAKDLTVHVVEQGDEEDQTTIPTRNINPEENFEQQLQQQQQQNQYESEPAMSIANNDMNNTNDIGNSNSLIASTLLEQLSVKSVPADHISTSTEQTFFYKEVLSTNTRHLIIVVEAPLKHGTTRKQNHEMGDSTMTHATEEEPIVLDFSITSDGNVVYHSPVRDTVVVAENIKDDIDPDGYLWSITRRAAHRAAAESAAATTPMSPIPLPEEY